MNAYVETGCTIEHEGRTFESGGTIVTPERIIAYLGENGTLTDWHGNTIGRYRITASWPIHSHLSAHMHQVYANVDGIEYSGRSCGKGMIYKGKARAR